MSTRERIEEEFELETEEQAFEDYAYIPFVISVNYSLMADELSLLGDFQEGLALDIGTGLGDLAIEVGKRYPRLKVVGIDFSQMAVKKATTKAQSEKLNNIIFQSADIHSFPFKDRSVDLIVSHGVIHHLRDPSMVFSEVYRVLKPNALAYITDLRRDAPDEIVKEVGANLPPSQAKGFINSVNASYIPKELEDMIAGLGIVNFSVSDQRFSREIIIKNKEKLRKSSMRKSDYTKLSLSITIRGS